MNKKDAIEIVKILKSTYPDAKCSLNFETPFQLVIAVMLSAQCTDERVNMVTPILFKRCPTIEDFISIDISELEEIIHSCGFYKNKSKNVKSCANQILNNFNGIVPNDINSLISLSGIGRKSANVIMLEVFGIAKGVAVDTHVKRICSLTGFSENKDPVKIEQDLVKLFPKEYLKDVNHLFVYHGRNTCVARSPKCNKCSISSFCEHYKRNHAI